MIKICPQCKNSFKTPASVQIYCNKRCYGLSQRVEHPVTPRDCYFRNREKRLKQAQEYQLKNRDRIRDYLREYSRKRRTKVIEFLGGKCKRCGFSDHRALQVDHVNGDGYKELRRTYETCMDPHTYAKAVMADTTGKYQLLCANCNWIKKHENEETTRKYKTKTLTTQLTMSDCLHLDGEVLPES